jgi:glycine C-acetyltransferase/8-amino-7-oxononanoate synthase
MEKFFIEQLEQLENKNLKRSLRNFSGETSSVISYQGEEYLNFSSNNYLGLANHPQLKKASIEAIQKYGTSSGASRLITGSHILHEELEFKTANFKNTEKSLVFNSGYQANLGVITSLVNRNDEIFSDQLNHASLIDGARLSKAKINIYPHNNLNHLEELLKKSKAPKKLIITDSVFSMDGDLAPIDQILKLAEKFNAWLFIDDAHATGVIGQNGRGSLNHFNLDPNHPLIIQMGTFGKALGSFGAYICGSTSLIDFLTNKARSFIYTTSLPPSVIATSIKSLEILENDSSLINQLWKNINYFKEEIEKLTIELLPSNSAIFPLIIGNPRTTMELSKKLFENKIIVQGIRPPTVPENSSRLRITLMSTHSKDQIDELLEKLKVFKFN